mmetsp:Transcript_48262/g.65699  ORF Transcript_48262/g.65699 Transcript_48262/m.65699 type:complete len:91 (-) Transcript_48262:71-343(-)|eukprot:CAMPEP_0185796342 /NCGR_PEP_ID=MMETSP1174-20130828/161030_1 /TAXON_ID=35687 /ORGANISM="Dictyocha speculum, Strain CCMP1381" /LENGTH=90 /DNA_ID=CAMNT_0028491697 /DNA_START=67 /DNA_END=339 /DNA_ORIENTATION=-
MALGSFDARFKSWSSLTGEEVDIQLSDGSLLSGNLIVVDPVSANLLIQLTEMVSSETTGVQHHHVVLVFSHSIVTFEKSVPLALETQVAD